MLVTLVLVKVAVSWLSSSFLLIMPIILCFLVCLHQTLKAAKVDFEKLLG